MSSKTTVYSYEEALHALEDGIEDIKVSSKYQGNELAFKSFIEALAKNATCKTLNLYGNEIGDKGAVAIGIAIRETKNCALVTLYLDSNEIGDRGAKEIAEALKKNSALQTLTLYNNNVGDVGAKEIAEALKTNSTLLTLDLGDNEIGVEGAKEIAGALKKNSTLQILNLYFNKIGDKGAVAIGNAIRENKNCALVTLELGPDGIAAEVEAGFKERVKTRFLDALNSDRKAPLNRMKLMLVGQGRAGKSSTVRSLLGKPFNSDWDSTIGADVSEGVMSANKPWIKQDQHDDFAPRFAARLMLTRANDVHQKHSVNVKSQDDIEDISTADAITLKTPKMEEGESSRSRKPEKLQQHRKQLTQREYSNLNMTKKVNHEHDIVREFDEKLLIEARQDSNSLTLSLWDFGGQQVFYSMHHIFLTKNGIYVLVFDMRELLKPATRKEAKTYLLFWVRSIKLHAPVAPVFLVGTFLADIIEEKDSLQVIDKLLRELTKSSFAQIVPPDDVEYGDLIFFPIDNKVRLGIERLRRAVEQRARDDDSAAEEVSIRWMAFLDSILSRKRNENSYLTLSDEVKSIGTNVGIPSVREVEEALAFFNERGLLIHLTSTEILKNIVVIKPQWLVNALSKVICDRDIHIDFEELKAVGLEEDARSTFKTGLATRDFLEYVWKGEQTEFFIDLMKRTMLLSEWTRDLYLIPSLLRGTFTIQESVGHRCLFDFSTSFLPNGVFQRLLCLCVEYSTRSFEVSKDPKMYENFASIQLEQGVLVHLLEVKEVQTIDVYVEKSEPAEKVLIVVQSMLQKINHDVLGSGLVWETYVENAVAKKLVRLSEAQEQKLSPWFNSDGRQAIKNISSKNVDLDTFLGNLS